MKKYNFVLISIMISFYLLAMKIEGPQLDRSKMKYYVIDYHKLFFLFFVK